MRGDRLLKNHASVRGIRGGCCSFCCFSELFPAFGRGYALSRGPD